MNIPYIWRPEIQPSKMALTTRAKSSNVDAIEDYILVVPLGRQAYALPWSVGLVIRPSRLDNSLTLPEAITASCLNSGQSAIFGRQDLVQVRSWGVPEH